MVGIYDYQEILFLPTPWMSKGLFLPSFPSIIIKMAISREAASVRFYKSGSLIKFYYFDAWQKIMYTHHIHIKAYVHTNIPPPANTLASTNTHTYTFTHTHTQMHTCMHIHTHTHPHTCMHTHNRTHRPACVHTHTHTHTQVHSHTQTPGLTCALDQLQTAPGCARQDALAQVTPGQSPGIALVQPAPGNGESPLATSCSIQANLCHKLKPTKIKTYSAPFQVQGT